MRLRLASIGAAFVISVGCSQPQAIDGGSGTPEARAVAFLSREVPAWSRENGCYSCHNNGDAARALYAATRQGYKVPTGSLADTTRWVISPAGWDRNKGDPGFSDKRLANLQFAAALVAALESGHTTDRAALGEAARRIAADQGDDGAWHIDPQNTVGSPATYGTTLATYMGWRILKEAGEPPAALRKAETWLQRANVENIPEAATLLWASTESWSFAAKQSKSLDLIRAAQTGDGGWGPYADAPPEAFDTALVLLALAKLRGTEDVDAMIARARKYLVAEQQSDGGWPATTRPRGGESYAQRVSTTGWAALALLQTAR